MKVAPGTRRLAGLQIWNEDLEIYNNLTLDEMCLKVVDLAVVNSNSPTSSSLPSMQTTLSGKVLYVDIMSCHSIDLVYIYFNAETM